MERDFLGLSSKDSVIVVEDDTKESVFMKGSAVQWPYSNKVSALPHFMPFRTLQEEKPKQTRFEPVVSSGFMPMSTTDAFDANQKAFANVLQKKVDRHGGTHYAMTTTYPMQQVDSYSTQRPNEIRPFSLSNQTISVAMSNPFFKTHVSTNGHNFAVANMNQQPLGGIPVMTHSVLPSASSMADQRNMSKPPAAPAQLTIFYGGSVCVYDDVSPEKAQAIMFLAGNGSSTNPHAGTPRNQMHGSSTNHHVGTPRTQLPAPTPKPIGGDVVLGNQSHSTSPCSGLSSPISVTSHPGLQLASGSSGTDELMTAKSIGVLTAPCSQPEPLRTIPSLGSTATLMPAAVPQARKASLARFLEKRKERVMSTAPYNTSENKSPESNTAPITPGSSAVSFSGNSSAVPVQANKEQTWRLGPVKSESSNGNLQ